MTRSMKSAPRGLLATLLALTATLTIAATSQAAGLPRIGGSWAAVPAFPSDVAPMTVTSGADGHIYLFGFCQGTCDQVGGPVAYGAPVTEIYDPSTSTWTAGKGAPASCAGAMASAVDANGMVHLAGCWRDIVSNPGFREAVYDPTAATWTMEFGHGPYADPIGGMAGPNGQIEWFSEILEKQGTAVFTVGYQVLVETDGLWFSGTGVPSTAPSDTAVLGRDGRVYAVGGSRDCQPEFGTCAVPAVQAYQPTTNSWRQVTSLPTPRIRVAAATDSRGRIFTMGGLAGDAHTLYATVQVYRPHTRTWAKAAPLPSARMAALATATPDGRVWLLGGYDAFGNPLADGVVFTPAAP